MTQQLMAFKPENVEPMAADIEYDQHDNGEKVLRIEVREYDKEPTRRYAIGDHVQHSSVAGALLEGAGHMTVNHISDESSGVGHHYHTTHYYSSAGWIPVRRDEELVTIHHYVHVNFQFVRAK